MNREKSDIRREIRRRKAAHTVAELKQLSEDVVARLRSLPAWQKAHTVLLYHSLPDEVETHELVRQAAADGKTVLLPVVCGDDLMLRRFDSEAGLETGAFNILEPTGQDFTDFADIDLAVIPGVAFTSDGWRLGRGRGFYDRLLPRLTNALKIGLCWPFQLLDTLPTEPHDIRMDDVVS